MEYDDEIRYIKQVLKTIAPYINSDSKEKVGSAYEFLFNSFLKIGNVYVDLIDGVYTPYAENRVFDDYCYHMSIYCAVKNIGDKVKQIIDKLEDKDD